MLKKFSALCIGLALLAGTAAHAEEDSVYAREGLYLGVGGTVAWDVAGGRLEDTSLDESVGANGRLGFRVTHWLAAELQGEWLSGFSVDEGPGEVDGWGVGPLLKFYGSQGVFQPYASAGVSYYELSFPVGSDEEDLGVRLGGGLDYYFSENGFLNLGLDYMLGTGDIAQFDYVALQFGIGFRLL